MCYSAQIYAELRRLEQRLPRLVDECEPYEVLEAFAGEAECLVEQAPAGYVEHIHATISCMLSSAGLIPGENESESCTLSKAGLAPSLAGVSRAMRGDRRGRHGATGGGDVAQSILCGMRRMSRDQGFLRKG